MQRGLELKDFAARLQAATPLKRDIVTPTQKAIGGRLALMPAKEWEPILSAA